MTSNITHEDILKLSKKKLTEIESIEILSVENIQNPDYLTKFEKTKIIGLRAEQLNQYFNPMIKIDPKKFNSSNYILKIAKKEVEQKLLPIKIKRQMPDGKYVIRTLQELKQFV